MRQGTLALAVLAFGPSAAVAEWCDPPIPPAPTSEALAREFREEFNDQFDQYFRAASRYTTCLDSERGRVVEEMRETALRYERLLDDSAEWGRQ